MSGITEDIVVKASEIKHNPNPSPYKVIDADTHYSEPVDLWTSRVAGKWKTLVPHQVGDKETGYKWMFNDGELLQASGGSSSCINPDGSKSPLWNWNIEGGKHVSEVHPASSQPKARIALMDQMGIYAQIVYPNILAFGSFRMAKSAPEIGKTIVSVYNDAMAEMQEETGRLFPMGVVPWWDVDAAVAEVNRFAKMGLRGINMCAEPHASGLPDLTDKYWDPLWAAATDHDLPINFHIGSSENSFASFSQGVWPGMDAARQQVVGSVQIELYNAKILSNLLASDLLPRWPKTKWVSVESGIGWIPFVIERLEYQLSDTPVDGIGGMDQPMPSELFRKQVYGCFWFEESGPMKLLEDIGFDNVMFETDFPHPTCKYPNAVEHAMRVLEPWGPEVQKKVLQDNAAKLYKIPV